MEFFQKQLQRLKRNPAFANAFDKRRTEAEVAFQIRQLRESKGWSQKGFSQEGRLQPPEKPSVCLGNGSRKIFFTRDLTGNMFWLFPPCSAPRAGSDCA